MFPVKKMAGSDTKLEGILPHLSENKNTGRTVVKKETNIEIPDLTNDAAKKILGRVDDLIELISRRRELIPPRGCPLISAALFYLLFCALSQACLEEAGTKNPLVYMIAMILNIGLVALLDCMLKADYKCCFLTEQELASQIYNKINNPGSGQLSALAEELNKITTLSSDTSTTKWDEVKAELETIVGDIKTKIEHAQPRSLSTV